MNISIFGLGYVGAVTAGCLTEAGHGVIGADVYPEKVDALNRGQSPIVEPELDALLAAACANGKLRATTSAEDAVTSTDASIICVGTPSLESGRLDLQYVRGVSAEIAEILKRTGKRHGLIFRSTMLPGSTRTMVEAFFGELIASGQVTVLYCPEFLREGTAVKDFRAPSLSVIGTTDSEACARPELEELLGRNPERLTWEGAELIKYACNYFHALKVAFANEIGRAGKVKGLDAAKVMEVVCKDTRLNISSYYMKPGNPFGGSCLPKDVSALAAFAREEGIVLPVLDSLIPSNGAHLDSLLALITRTGLRRVAILGLAFKNNTDDLRGSPMVAVAETLLARGYELSIYDPHLNIAELIGSNERLISRRMPHLAQLLKKSGTEAVKNADLILAAQKCVPLDELRTAVRAEQHIIDVNGWRELATLPARYEGFCW